jgi:hypothetical protein
MRNPNVRQAMFPYGMSKNADGSWTFFNRHYKTLGTITDDWSEWDDPRYKMYLKGLGAATLAKLDHEGVGSGDRIYFYDDRTNPENSPAHMQAYLEKLRILIGLQSKPEGRTDRRR